MSVDNATAANTNITNNFYNNDVASHNDNSGVTVGGVENLPEGTTDQDVQNAVTNGVLMSFVELLNSMIASDPDMDPDMKDYLLGSLGTLMANNKLDVDSEVQTKVDADHGETNDIVAKSMMDLLMAKFEETASEERANEATNVDSKQGNSEEGEGGGNWMIQLAKGLAEVQSMWLGKMMDSYEDMKENTVPALAEDATDTQKNEEAEQRKAFIQAQAETTAYGRLFGMASEVTSNVLKSLGDGLTSVARKQ